jgi:hypothetical protein
MSLLSKASSAISAPNSMPSISGTTPTVSNRCPGSRTNQNEIAERVGEVEDLGRHAPFGAADGLALSPPFVALAVTMDLDDGGVDHGVLHVRLVRDRIEKLFEKHPLSPSLDTA